MDDGHLQGGAALPVFRHHVITRLLGSDWLSVTCLRTAQLFATVAKERWDIIKIIIIIMDWIHIVLFKASKALYIEPIFHLHCIHTGGGKLHV